MPKVTELRSTYIQACKVGPPGAPTRCAVRLAKAVAEVDLDALALLFRQYQHECQRAEEARRPLDESEAPTAREVAAYDWACQDVQNAAHRLAQGLAKSGLF